MGKYDINIKGLGLLLLPTFLRKGVIGALLYAVLAPVNELNARFRNLRKNCNYRLYHNGQVCYLRAMMNDYFDPYYRRITITEEAQFAENSVLYKRDVNTNEPVPVREPLTGRGDPAGQPSEYEGDDGVIYVDDPLPVPDDIPAGRLIARRGFGGASSYDFWVNIPYELYPKIDRPRFEAIVKQYKLATKRFAINYM